MVIRKNEKNNIRPKLADESLRRECIRNYERLDGCGSPRLRIWKSVEKGIDAGSVVSDE